MNILSKIDVQCSTLSYRDIEEAVECIAKTFSLGEPMTSLLQITENEFRYFARIFIEKTAQEGLSVVARNAETGQFLGCIICEDYVTDLPEGIGMISPNFGPIVELLDTLGANYKADNNVAKGEIYHLFMGGVYPQYAGLNIAKTLTEHLENMARNKGYSKAIGEVTGPISQHVYIDKLGYSPVYDISYKDFIFEGNTVFEAINSCESCILIVKDL